MGYREFAVPVHGAECGWASAVPFGAVAGDHAVLPDGAMDLVWTGTDLLVAGPDTAAHPARRSPGEVATGVRFRPGVLPALLGVPAHVLLDQRVPLVDLHPAVAAATLSRIEAASGSAGGRVTRPSAGRNPTDRDPSAAGSVGGEFVAEALVTAARSLPGRADRALLVAAERLGAGASAADTADALGWTTRTLHRRSLAAFGYGPAVLRRVLRFRRAVDLLHAGCSPADAAARAGYADQPHLSREVRALAGRSPTELVGDQLGSGA